LAIINGIIKYIMLVSATAIIQMQGQHSSAFNKTL